MQLAATVRCARRAPPRFPHFGVTSVTPKSHHFPTPSAPPVGASSVALARARATEPGVWSGQGRERAGQSQKSLVVALSRAPCWGCDLGVFSPCQCRCWRLNLENLRDPRAQPATPRAHSPHPTATLRVCGFGGRSWAHSTPPNFKNPLQQYRRGHRPHRCYKISCRRRSPQKKPRLWVDGGSCEGRFIQRN